MITARPLSRLPRLLLALAVVIGPIIGFAVYRYATTVEQDQTRDRLAGRVRAAASAIESELRTDLEILYSLKSRFEATVPVTGEEFYDIARSFLDRHPCTQALGWIPHVSRSDRSAHEQRLRATGFADYVISERAAAGDMVAAGDREHYYPVAFVVPFEGNEHVLGFDVTSESVRATALVRATSSGEPALTDPVTLGPGASSSNGVLGFLAVSGDASGKVQAGTKTAMGFVSATYRIDTLLHRAGLGPGDEAVTTIHFELVDDDVGGQERVVLGSPVDLDTRLVPSMSVQQPIDIGGQNWRLVAHPTAAYLASLRTRQPLMLGASTALGWELMVGFFIVLGNRSRDQLNRGHHQSVTNILESINDGVIVADRNGKILFTNQAAAAVSGTLRSDLPPSAWSKEHGFFLPGTDQPFPTDDLPLTRAIRGEAINDVELQVCNPRVPDGIRVSVRGGPLLDGQGVVRGGVVVFRDITEGRKREDRLLQLSNAVEQTADTVIITDRKGTIEYVNPSFETTTGYSSAEAVGRNPNILKSGEQSEDFYRDLWATILRGEPFRGTTINRKKNGTLYHAEQTITGIKDSDGHITHFVSVLKDMTERHKIRKQEIELELASMVQRRLYPTAPPEIAGYDISGAVFSAEATCGDYFDFVPLPDHALALVVADATGHGVGPALVMTQTRAYLRSLAQTTDDLAVITGGINGFLFNDLKDDFFVTMMIARLEPATGRLTYVSSGHPDGYVIAGSGEVAAKLASNCLPLGMFLEEWRCKSHEAVIHEDELAVFVTDGVFECESPNGTEFGRERLIEVVSKHRRETASEIVDEVYDAIRNFSQRDKPVDDVTIIVCKRNPRVS